MSQKTTYKDSGVDIEKAESAFDTLKDRINATHTPEVLSSVGLFGGFYDLSSIDMAHPVLVSSTDGVGTKLRVAVLAGRHDTVGQDLVNHCINDIAVCGARPLFFLDYFACGSLEPEVYQQVIGGVAEGCRLAGIPLIGGETAEMPDFYQADDYDLCGTIVGIVERSRVITGHEICPGDILVGVSGNGLHTNGYTLARRVLLTRFGADSTPRELGQTVAEEMLRIHPNYYPVIAKLTAGASIKGIAHITGGGILKNTNRLLPEDCRLAIDWGSWPVDPVFDLIQAAGDVPQEDMRLTFNMGLGLVLVVDAGQRDAVMDLGADTGYRFYEIGRVERDT